jgi:hypothetical protein
MAQASRRELTRSLNLLGRAIELILRLGELAGRNNGRVSVLREKLKRAQAELDAHRESQPLDKRRVRHKSDQVLGLAIEYLIALLTADRGRR